MAGAAHDSIDEHGVPVCSYGAHIFHTNSAPVKEFAERFASWVPYVHRVKAMARGSLFSFPINLDTLYKLWGCRTPGQAEQLLYERVGRFPQYQNLEEWVVHKLGWELYELFFKGYTQKQYGCDPKLLPPSIAQRLPIRLTYDDRYFAARWCAMPIMGYTAFVENMLRHDNIEVRLSTPFHSLGNWRREAKRLVFCGRPEGLEGVQLGRLQYLSMAFKQETYKGDYQGIGVVNWCDLAVPQLRSVQCSHFYPNYHKHTTTVVIKGCTVMTDFPNHSPDGEPYYPIATKENKELHRQYVRAMPHDVVLGGRLGEYKYYDMDQAIASAIATARDLCS